MVLNWSKLLSTGHSTVALAIVFCFISIKKIIKSNFSSREKCSVTPTLTYIKIVSALLFC